VRTPGVVKLEPRGDADVRLAAVSIALQVDVLVFEGAPKQLDEHVIHPSAAAVHRDAHTGGRQRGGEGGAGKLAALIGIEAPLSKERGASFYKGPQFIVRVDAWEIGVTNRINEHRGKVSGVTMHITPFFQFALGLVIPGALVILLVALLWTSRT
jgi:hypothetical protein